MVFNVEHFFDNDGDLLWGYTFLIPVVDDIHHCI